jgi:hypothetical protein
MSKSIAARLAKLEAASAPASSIRILWTEEGEDISPRIDAMLTRGVAINSDRFVSVGWLTAPEDSTNG